MIFNVERKWIFSIEHERVLRFCRDMKLIPIWEQLFNCKPKDDAMLAVATWNLKEVRARLRQALMHRYPGQLFLVVDHSHFKIENGYLAENNIYIYKLGCANMIGTGYTDAPPLKLQAHILTATEINSPDGDPSDFISSSMYDLHVAEYYEKLYGEHPEDFQADTNSDAEYSQVLRMLWTRTLCVIEKFRKKHNYVLDPCAYDLKFNWRTCDDIDAPVVIKFDLLDEAGNINEGV